MSVRRLDVSRCSRCLSYIYRKLLRVVPWNWSPRGAASSTAVEAGAFWPFALRRQTGFSGDCGIGGARWLQDGQQEATGFEFNKR